MVVTKTRTKIMVMVRLRPIRINSNQLVSIITGLMSTYFARSARISLELIVNQ